MTEHAAELKVALGARNTREDSYSGCGFWGPDRRPGGSMHYTNSQMKLDQLIGYFNGKKISLIPPFQRGRAWPLSARQKLLENMVKGRPIPAIFLYKQEDGSQFSYNILDGKQRLESLILFIGNQRADLRVDGINDYFFGPKERALTNFEIEIDGKSQAFKNLSNEVVRQFREYAIPTIEIDLDENGTLDEIIQLFVDINQTGVKVKRFDIVNSIEVRQISSQTRCARCGQWEYER